MAKRPRVRGVERVQASPEEQRAFVDWVDARRERFLGEIRRKLGPRLAAVVEPEDVLQNSLVAGLLLLHRVSRTGRDFGPWFRRILHLRILELSRGERRALQRPLPASQVVPGLELDDMPAPCAGVPDEEVDGLRAAIVGLPSEERRCVVLRDFLGLSWRTVGLLLERSGSSARRIHHDARGRLARALARTGAAPPAGVGIPRRLPRRSGDPSP